MAPKAVWLCPCGCIVHLFLYLDNDLSSSLIYCCYHLHSVSFLCILSVHGLFYHSVSVYIIQVRKNSLDSVSVYESKYLWFHSRKNPIVTTAHLYYPFHSIALGLLCSPSSLYQILGLLRAVLSSLSLECPQRLIIDIVYSRHRTSGSLCLSCMLSPLACRVGYVG